MARTKTHSGTFNEDMLDDGVINTPDVSPEDLPVQPEPTMLESYEIRLERLRAEIQFGLDDYEAGRVLTVSSAQELYDSIMSDGNDRDEPEGAEETEIHRAGRA